jgi:hypothetical protein
MVVGWREMYLTTGTQKESPVFVVPVLIRNPCVKHQVTNEDMDCRFNPRRSPHSDWQVDQLMSHNCQNTS